MTNKWTVTVQEDPDSDDLILPFPPDLLENMGWKEGDTLKWTEHEDGSWSIKKIDDIQ